MRALSIAAIVAAALPAGLSGGAAGAQELCLFGGPDPRADLACGPAYVALDSRRDAAPSRITASGAARASSSADGAAQSRLLAGGPALPAGPALPGAYAAPAPYAPAPVETYAYGGAPAAYIVAPPAATPQSWPAPDAAYMSAQGGAAPPPPDFGTYVAVEGAAPAPGAFAYAYESADGGAYAYRYETPNGPAWAYAYQTPEGWAYAYAYDSAPAAPPPAMIQAGVAEPRPYRGPYAQQVYAHAEESHFDHRTDWRYSEQRLFGASYARQLYLVQTYYRESEWVAVSAIPGRRYLCGGGCAGGGYASGAGGAFIGAPTHGPLISGGGGFGGFVTQAGSYLVGGNMSGGLGGGMGGGSGASQTVNVSNSASQTMQGQATAIGNQTVVGGAPFTPPAGAPPPPWAASAAGPGGNVASAYAGANAAANSSANAGM